MSDEKKLTHSDKEKEILKYWDKNQCFEKSVENRPEGNPYVFYDGPPFATGLPHYGHLVGSVMKDVVPRFWTMKGYRVERTWGWDCHGLPIENIVEKEQNLGSKKDIEEYGIAKFNDTCHSKVLMYAEEWKKVIRRLGRWVDMDGAYKTMDFEYMESIWWVFKQLWDKEMIYEGRKPMHICPRCETVLSNFEVTDGYKDVTDISVFVTFKLRDGRYSGSNLIAWTTTPWTLPGNALLAINKNRTFVKFKVNKIDSSCPFKFIVGESYLVLSDPGVQDRLFGGKTELFPDDYSKGYIAKENDHSIKLVEFSEFESVVLPENIIGSHYEPLFETFKDHKDAFRVVGADFVTDEDGTGVVHIAPGFGEDDMELGKKEGVEPIIHVVMNGQFVEELVTDLEAEGYTVKDIPVRKKEDPNDVDIQIIKYLAHHNRLLAKEKITHSYPHCWRCDTPLLNYSTSSWFVRVTEIKDKLVATNKEINWVPGNIKEGRFGKWLEGARDWAISRSRYWGAPLPVWKSEDGDVICVGSAAELAELSGEKLTDLHKHIVDEVVIEKDGKTYHRIDEVLDCWFESGSMPYAQLHYPFENEQKFDRGFPAEFIAEGQDQTRGWFYTLHILSNALFEMPAFKNVIVNGIVLAEDGKKMSKKLNNYPDPMEVMEKYGADAVRYYLMSTPVVKAENLRFSEAGVDEVSKKFINIMRNVLSFYQLYSEHDDGRDPKAEHVLDAWILSRLNQTLQEETEAMEAYELADAARTLQNFVTDLSTWYVRRSRDRVKIEGADRVEALSALRMVLETFAKMVAPFMPFLAEDIYHGINGDFVGSEVRMSVHLEDWPEVGNVAEKILEDMGQARAIVSRALDAREEAGRPIKQVLASMQVKVPNGEIEDGYLEVIKDEVNVKEIEISEGELSVELDVELTPELIREGMARDVVRRVNQLRKDVGLTIQDRVDLKISSDSEEVKKMVEEHGDAIKDGALASAISFVKDESAKHQNEFRISEHDVWIGF